MKFKAFYRISRDCAGLPMNYEGARYISADDESADLEKIVRGQLMADYKVGDSDIEISRIDRA